MMGEDTLVLGVAQAQVVIDAVVAGDDDIGSPARTQP